MKYILLCFVVILSACENKETKKITLDTTKADNVVVLNDDDKEMNNAISAAFATFPVFEAALKKPQLNQERFGIKMRFAWGESNGEHMWLNNIFYKDDKLFGVLASEPQNIKDYKAGDTIEIDRNSISDWSYIEDGYLKGGYTIKLLYDRLNDADKKYIEEEMGAKIE